MSQVSVENKTIASVIPGDIIEEMQQENKTLQEVLSEGVKYKKGDLFTFQLDFAGRKIIILKFLGSMGRSKKVFDVEGDIPLKNIDYAIASTPLDAAKLVCLGVKDLKNAKQYFQPEHREETSFWDRYLST